jgi:glycosyltransferase involved in cell wall biosynthesis
LAPRLAHPSVEVMPYTNDLRSAYQSCDALVLASIEEGSALVTYEAMACGAALLVSESSGAHAEHMREALIHRTADVTALRTHMDRLAGDPVLLAALRRNARETARSLTWADAGRVLDEAYRARV